MSIFNTEINNIKLSVDKIQKDLAIRVQKFEKIFAKQIFEAEANHKDLVFALDLDNDLKTYNLTFKNKIYEKTILNLQIFDTLYNTNNSIESLNLGFIEEIHYIVNPNSITNMENNIFIMKNYKLKGESEIYDSSHRKTSCIGLNISPVEVYILGNDLELKEKHQKALSFLSFIGLNDNKYNTNNGLMSLSSMGQYYVTEPIIINQKILKEFKKNYATKFLGKDMMQQLETSYLQTKITNSTNKKNIKI